MGKLDSAYDVFLQNQPCGGVDHAYSDNFEYKHNHVLIYNADVMSIVHQNMIVFIHKLIIKIGLVYILVQVVLQKHIICKIWLAQEYKNPIILNTIMF